MPIVVDGQLMHYCNGTATGREGANLGGALIIFKSLIFMAPRVGLDLSRKSLNCRWDFPGSARRTPKATPQKLCWHDTG